MTPRGLLKLFGRTERRQVRVVRVVWVVRIGGLKPRGGIRHNGRDGLQAVPAVPPIGGLHARPGLLAHILGQRLPLVQWISQVPNSLRAFAACV